ncbi:riboflavin kinase [Spathaspora passalidarum NRRL Y-27907]|uniref:Riboflavin kinase n=1 Tax=Spathaspora passalidarum (strain NRRL Y-27907 / 11-Y1) TaxID=619300 RepID=G3AHY1_SPAPN|nr:riboflavin kinase [Spathaspora passalidarum NRRL Y-27907]EGW34295.1 riboflavin kinase [Spathaspora passalidarum NRRL Y-27907]
MHRPDANIPVKPESPYPIYDQTSIILGYGRGAGELGIPTANIPIRKEISHLPTGIYFGYAKLIPLTGEKDVTKSRATRYGHHEQILFNHGNKLSEEDLEVLPVVMSLGWNPFFHNEEKAAELHIIRKFKDTFYGAGVKYVILGYIRPELDYVSKEALIDDINKDIEIAKKVLSTEQYLAFKKELLDFVPYD